MLLCLASAALLAASVPTGAAGEIGFPAQRRELITRTEAKLRKRCRKLVKVQNKLEKAAGNEKKTTKLQGKLEKLRRRGATKAACGLANRCSDDFLGTLDNEDTFLDENKQYNLEPIKEEIVASAPSQNFFNTPGEPVPYGAYLGHGCYPVGEVTEGGEPLVGAYYLYNPYPSTGAVSLSWRDADPYYDCCCDDTPGVCVQGDSGFELTGPLGD